MKTKEIILEVGQNNHVAKGEIRLIKRINHQEILFEGESLIHHGEHGIIKTSGIVHKINQVEFDPVRRIITRAYD